MNSSTLKYHWLFVSLGILAAGFFIWYFHVVVLYMLGAAAVSLIGRPLVIVLERVRIRGKKISRGLSAAITLATILSLFIGLCIALIPTVTHNLHHLSTLNTDVLSTSITEATIHIEEWVNSLIPSAHFSVKDAIKEYVMPFFQSGALQGVLRGLTTAVADVIMAIFSISFISFFFLKDDKLFYNIILILMPKRHEKAVERALNSSVNLLGRYFIGIVLESTIKFVVVTFSLYFLGMELTTASVIGVVTSVLNVIPYIGPIIGALLAIAIAMFSPLPAGSSFIEFIFEITVVLTLFQLFDNIIIQPYIYSSSVKAHPLEIFLVILMAGYVGGVLGMLLAIPIYTVGRVFAKEFFANTRVIKKLTENI